MKIGIALPARNVRPYVEAFLTTAKAQTHRCLVYVVEDASDDGTYEFLKNRTTWYRKLIRNTERQGWPISLNRAADLAIRDGCEAVFTANADDLLRLDCIEKAVAALEGHDFVSVYGQQIGGDNCVMAAHPEAVHRALVPKDFRPYLPMTNFQLIRSDVWKAVGGYSTDLMPPGTHGAVEDWEFTLKLIKAGFTYGLVKDPAYYWIMRGPSQLHLQRLPHLDEAMRLMALKHPDVFGA